MQMNKITWSSVGVLFPTIDTSQFPLHRVCHKERKALWRGPRWCFKRTRCGGNRRVLMVGNNTPTVELDDFVKVHHCAPTTISRYWHQAPPRGTGLDGL